jgi:hypothetical protein
LKSKGEVLGGVACSSSAGLFVLGVVVGPIVLNLLERNESG